MRFSLRAFLIAIALLAAFCYCWFVLPAANAERFVQAVVAQDYDAADRMLSRQFIANSAKEYWAFESKASLLPLSLGQLLSGQRLVRLQFDYFHLDRNVSVFTEIRARAFGLSQTGNSSINEGMLIDQSSEVSISR